MCVKRFLPEPALSVAEGVEMTQKVVFTEVYCFMLLKVKTLKTFWTQRTLRITKNSEISIYFFYDAVFQKEHLIFPCRPSLILSFYLIAFLCEFCVPQCSLCPILQKSIILKRVLKNRLFFYCFLNARTTFQLNINNHFQSGSLFPFDP